MAHPFFEMLGLENPWPEDRLAELEKKAARIKDLVRRIAEAMVRCRVKIERLRQKVELSPSDQGRRMLEVCEARYQELLGRMGRAKQKLSDVQRAIRRPGS